MKVFEIEFVRVSPLQNKTIYLEGMSESEVMSRFSSSSSKFVRCLKARTFVNLEHVAEVNFKGEVKRET